MYPNEHASPLEKLPIGTEYVFDTIYNPPETALMKLAPRSVKTRNGLLMLVLQAAYAQTIWFGTQFDSADLTRILRLLSGDMAKKTSARRIRQAKYCAVRIYGQRQNDDWQKARARVAV